MVIGMLGCHGGKEAAHGKNIMKQKVNKRYVGIKEVSLYTSLPVKTLYEWAGTGRIPSIKMGRRVLFDLNDIDKVMESLKRTYNHYEKTVNKISGDICGN
jgi:excisionase family DNA binding protein